MESHFLDLDNKIAKIESKLSININGGNLIENHYF
jgi:hypothetical protein